MTNITIIGLGLIGGSIARDLKSQLNVNVTGVDNNLEHANLAKKLELVHQMSSLDEGIISAEIIIVAIPVNAIEKVLPELMDKISTDTIVIDVGSTKEGICASIAGHPKRGRYVAAHPLAGTEFSGPAAAIKGLFSGKKNIICDREKSDDDALDLAIKLFSSIGMDTYFLSSAEHDNHLAYVSHLSHISSFTLSLTVLDIEKNEDQIFNLASTGFDSTVRLAKSSPDTWTPIFEKNRLHLIEALDRYGKHLDLFKKALKENDTAGIRKLIAEANQIKRVLQN